MSREFDIKEKLKIKIPTTETSFIQISASYHEVLSHLFNNDPHFDQLLKVSEKLFNQSFNDNPPHKRLDINPSIWDSPNGLTNYFLRQFDFNVKDNDTWSKFRSIICGAYDVPKLLLYLSKKNLIDNETDTWTLLQNLIEYKKLCDKK